MLFIAFAKIRAGKMGIGDRRIKLTNEVLSGIRILKYYAWEHPFCDQIEEIRAVELEKLMYMNIIMVFVVMGITSIPYIMPMVIFYTYISINNQQMNISMAFTVITLLGIVTAQIQNLPQFVQRFVQAKVSANRLQEFLLCEEQTGYISMLDASDTEHAIVLENANISWLLKEKKDDSNTPEAQNNESPPVDNAEIGIELKGGEKGQYSVVEQQTTDDKDAELVTGESQKEEGKADTELIHRSLHTLIDFNLKIRKGQLVAVVGPVGSGKSSFIYSLLGDMQLLSGSVSISTSNIAYHAQQPWILNNTVRENILFGLPDNEQRFSDAIFASCLQSDIDLLPGGLETEIGEKGKK